MQLIGHLVDRRGELEDLVGELNDLLVLVLLGLHRLPLGVGQHLAAGGGALGLFTAVRSLRAVESRIAGPLADAGLSKAEIRELSRLAGLPTWDRPASACLSSRIPYGTPVTIETVKKVETGEEQVKDLGFRQFRVRFHGELVRLEVAPDEMEKALSLAMAQRLTAIFKGLGFKYITLDLQGYRQGAMNEVLNLRA